MKLKFFIIFFVLFYSCTKRISVLKIPQNHNYFITKFNFKKSLITDKEQKFLTNYYIFRFVSPFIKIKPSFSKKFVSWGFRKIKRKKYYFTNHKLVNKKFLRKVWRNAQLDKYPNSFIRAITIRNTYIRVLPVDIPIFSKTNNFPFDIMQNSSIYAGTPVLITHISKDKQWAFIENYIAAGWIKVSDVAYVNENFIEKWFSNRFVAPIKDRIPIYDNYGNFQFLGFIGSQFPISKEHKNYFTAKIPVKLRNGYAAIKKVKLPKKYFTLKPMKLTYKNLAKIANELTGEPYFWGGLYFYRDCSMTLRDLFSVFDIYLPRNSYDQVHFSFLGRYKNISKLNPENKEEFLLKKGIPYLTLVWFPGHIMLYIGKYNNHALIFHNFWSIRLKNGRRKIVGQAAITTLFPGENLPDVMKKSDYRYKIKGIKYVIDLN